MTFNKSVFILLVILLLQSHASLASGIDCKQAQAGFDKTICGSPTLLEKDKNLTTAYEALKAKLSPEAQEDFKIGQKTWLSFVRQQCSDTYMKKYNDYQTVCGNDTGCSIKGYYDNQSDCIDGEYNARIESLENTLKNSKDDFLVVNTKLAGVYPPLDEDDRNDSAGNAEYDVSYPQIYIPYSAGIKKWNTKHRQPPSRDRGDGGCQRNSDYTTTIVTPHLLSVAFNQDWDCSHMPHGNSSSNVENIKLPSGNPIQATDIFDENKSWENALSKMVSESLITEMEERYQHERDHGITRPLSCVKEMKHVATPERLKNFVTDVEDWTLSSQGLEIIINSYELTSYVCSPSGANFSWDQLKPYLRKDFLAELDSAKDTQ